MHEVMRCFRYSLSLANHHTLQFEQISRCRSHRELVAIQDVLVCYEPARASPTSGPPVLLPNKGGIVFWCVGEEFPTARREVKVWKLTQCAVTRPQGSEGEVNSLVIAEGSNSAWP